MTVNSEVAVNIRPACDVDVDAMRELYNHYVLTNTCTFDTTEQTREERLQWLKQHEQSSLPVLIAEIDGNVIGWASLSYYHSRCAYRTTVEFSAYVDHRRHRKGVGTQLVQELMRLAKRNNFHCVVGLICSENETSLKMAYQLGFERVGELKEVGRKFDRWLNVTFVQKLLAN